MSDWTIDLINYGESRSWRPLPRRRALRDFREYADLEVSGGFAADRALRCGYIALAKATPEERAACTDWQAVKDLQERQEAARVAKLTERQAETKRIVNLHRDEQRWVIAGLYLEDFNDLDRHTLRDLEKWREWSAPTFQFRACEIFAVCVDETGNEVVRINWSEYFRDQTGTYNRSYSFEDVTQDLVDYFLTH